MLSFTIANIAALVDFRLRTSIVLIFIPLFFTILSSLLVVYFFKRIKLILGINSLLTKANLYLILFADILIINYICLAGIYLFSSNYADHAEVNIADVSWLFQTGKQLYPLLASAERYINNYGPAVYVINGFFLNLFTPSIFSSKITGVLAGFISLLSIFFTLKKVGGTQIAIICCAYISLILLSPNAAPSLLSASFWLRPDSLILMCVALGLLVVVSTNAPLAILLCTLLLGISLNLKFFAAFYLLPVYVIFLLRFGLYYTLVSISGSIIIAIAPFICSTQISWHNYILWMSKVSKQELYFRTFLRNIAWLVYVCIPILVALLYLFFKSKREFYLFIRQNIAYIAALIIGSAAITATGLKPGATENNMLPLIPTLAYFFILVLTKIRNVTHKSIAWGSKFKYFYLTIVSTALALLVSTLVVVIPHEFILIQQLIKYPGAANDVEAVVKSYPNTQIEMGYSKSYELSFYQPVLVFHGNPYLVDASSMMEMQESKIDPISAKTLAALNSCQVKIWLIPKGEPPFQLNSYYPPYKQLFSREFQTIFAERYALRSHTQYYDLWFCKNARLTTAKATADESS